MHFYRSYLLNCLADVYSNKPSSKDIWNDPKNKYKDEEKLPRSHLIDKFLDL